MTKRSQSLIPASREREKEWRRQEILKAAVRVFAAKGYEITTLDQIAAAAGFGKGTLYNYFTSKEELFSVLIEEGIESFHHFLGKRLQPVKGTTERLDVYIEASLEFQKENPEFLKIYMLQMIPSSAFQGPLRDRLKAVWKRKLSTLVSIFRKGIAEGLFRSGDPVQMATALKWMINSQYYILLTSPRADAAQSAEFIKQVWHSGILVKKRRKKR